MAFAWMALSAVIGATLAMPHGWFDLFVPFGWPVGCPVGRVVAAVLVAPFPLERLGDEIVADLRADTAEGRLSNVAEELSIAIHEPADHVVVHPPPTSRTSGRSEVAWTATKVIAFASGRRHLPSCCARRRRGPEPLLRA